MSTLVTKQPFIRRQFPFYNSRVCFYALNNLSVSQLNTVSHCVCLSHTTTTQAPRDKTWQNPSENQHSCFITDGHNPGTLSFGVLTLIHRWQTCYKYFTIIASWWAPHCQVKMRIHTDNVWNAFSVTWTKPFLFWSHKWWGWSSACAHLHNR